MELYIVREAGSADFEIAKSIEHVWRYLNVHRLENDDADLALTELELNEDENASVRFVSRKEGRVIEVSRKKTLVF